MTTIQDRITENFRKQFYDEFGFCKNQYLLRDSNQFILEDFKQFLLTSIKEVEEETRKEMFNLEELNKDWVNHFYESDWHCDTLKETKFEEELKGELTTFLPRHMDVYDWNLPYADMIILIIRNLLKGKKLING